MIPNVIFHDSSTATNLSTKKLAIILDANMEEETILIISAMNYLEIVVPYVT